jgi:hypothetical protein
MVAARAGTAWINPVMTPSPMDYAPYVAAQTSEPVASQLTYPGPPPGFTQLVFYGFPEIATWDPNATVDVYDFTIYTPLEVSADEWTTLMQSAHDGLIGMGDDLLGYEVDEQPLVNISIPDQVCIPDPLGGSPFCITPPGGGSTIQIGFAYRLWVLIGTGGGSSAGYRAAVRAQGFLTIIGYVIGLIGAAMTILNVTNASQSSTSISNLQNELNTILNAPGKNVAEAFSPINTTVLILGLGSIAIGVFAILHGQQPPPTTIPPVSVGGNVSGPEGLGIGGQFSTMPPAQQGSSRSRR